MNFNTALLEQSQVCTYWHADILCEKRRTFRVVQLYSSYGGKTSPLVKTPQS